MIDEKRSLKVFLCHASADKPKVRELYRRLVHDGIDAWLDEAKLLPGMEWQLEIPKAVQNADAIVICLSNNSVTKEGYVQKEIRFALDVADEKPEGTIYLIPVRLDDCAVPSRLVRWQWVDLFTTDGYRKLRRSLRMRADSIGAGFSSLSRRPEVDNHDVQVNSNPTKPPEEDDYKVNFGLNVRLFVLITIIILACIGTFWAGTKMAGKLAARTPSPALTLAPAASFTPEPPVVTVSFSPTQVPPSEILIETATPFIPLPPTDNPVPTQPPLPTYTTVPPTPTATPAMALIPAGSFMMGNNSGYSDEKPAHLVYLDSFYIDQYEVTNGKYSYCVGNGVCKKPLVSTPNAPGNYYSPDYLGYPVINVSWEMAKIYCEWRGARLPTEAEWEKAARGGLQDSLYPWGNATPVCDAGAVNGARFAGCTGDGPVKVGSFASNGYQLYDMLGNVSEWVSDWYAPDYYANGSANSSNPTGPLTGTLRVLRGGSWSQKNTILLSTRGRSAPSTQNNQTGFRCARDTQP